jgi:transcription elongation factor GreA
MDDNQQNNAEYLSSQGFSKLKEELLFLKEKKRKEVAERLEYAKSLGDLSENAEYAEAKEEQQTVEGRIADLEDILSRAVLISSSTVHDHADIGATVVAKKEGSDREDAFLIVGREEADPSKNLISNESPLGRALIGKKKNEEVIVLTPKGEIRYQILDVK